MKGKERREGRREHNERAWTEYWRSGIPIRTFDVYSIGI